MELKVNYHSQEALSVILRAEQRMDEAEVILSNLIALVDHESESFKIPFDDVLVMIRLAVRLLAER